MKLKQAYGIAGGLVMALRPVCERVEIAGSIRRGKAEVKDIEIVCVPTMELVESLLLFPVDGFMGQPMYEQRSLLDERLSDMVRTRSLFIVNKFYELLKRFQVPPLDCQTKFVLVIVLAPAQ